MDVAVSKTHPHKVNQPVANQSILTIVGDEYLMGTHFSPVAARVPARIKNKVEERAEIFVSTGINRTCGKTHEANKNVCAAPV